MSFYVYSIFNINNGKFYIGKSNNPSFRWTVHKRLALQGSNDCPKLYGAIRKYGSDKFTHCTLQKFYLESDALKAETYYIRFFNSIKFGYNCLEDVDSRIGYITSEETKIKQSKSRLAYYENNIHPLLGKPRNENTKVKIANTLNGRYFGENSPSSKLTNVQRLEIIKYSDEGFSQRKIAAIYGASQWSIWNILKNRHKYK